MPPHDVGPSSLVQIGPGPKPSWIAAESGSGFGTTRVASTVARYRLRTVCQAARCPNVNECWAAGTATFMVMGERCARGCRFCHVPHARTLAPLDPGEPARIAGAVEALGLTHAVITSVARDDLTDHGAAHLAEVVRALHAAAPFTVVELLIPDLGGDLGRLLQVLVTEPDVLAHNIETVERLTPLVRDRRASYRQSLAVLAAARFLAPEAIVKTGVMLGLGETDGEVEHTLADLAAAGVHIVTVGQYLRPTERQAPVRAWVPPSRFIEVAELARECGIAAVAAGPLVRSSHRAHELYAKVQERITSRAEHFDAREHRAEGIGS